MEISRPRAVLPVVAEVPGAGIIVTSLEIWEEHAVLCYHATTAGGRVRGVVWEASDDLGTTYNGLGGSSGSSPGGAAMTRGDWWFRPAPPPGAGVLTLTAIDERGRESGRIEIALR